MAIMSGFDTETMERVFDPNDKESQVAFWEDVRNTSTWQRSKSKFGFTAGNQARLDDVLTKLHGDAEFFTLSAFIDAVNVAMNAGEVVRKPVAPVVEQATIPVDKNGRPLTAAQIQWGQFTNWSQTASSAQIKERCRTEEAYAKFHTSCLKKEMNQPIDGDVRPLNPHLSQTSTPTRASMADQRLVNFATRFRKMSSEDVRKARRLDVSPLTARQFVADENECYRLGLL